MQLFDLIIHIRQLISLTPYLLLLCTNFTRLARSRRVEEKNNVVIFEKIDLVHPIVKNS